MAELKKIKTISDGVYGSQLNTTNGYVNWGFEETNGINEKNPNKLSLGQISWKPETVPKKTKANIWKNMIAISIGFLFLFTAYSALANIQSSLNEVGGLGVASLSVIYGALVLSCMFLPSIIISKLGCKWTICVAMLMYSTYMAANFYPHWGTLIPTSVILGFAAAPLWSAKCTYLTQVGGDYADIVGESSETSIVRFFGFFFMIFQSGQITGNIISSVVLQPGGDQNTSISIDQLGICGARYCNQELPYFINSSEKSNSTTSQPKEKLYMLCGIYTACAIMAAIIIALIVDPLQRSSDSKNSAATATPTSLFLATFKHMKNKKQKLLIPLTVYSGIEQAFMTAEFTKSLVTCSLGIHKVGLVMVCYGVVDAICSVGFSPLVKIIGRLPIYSFGAAINISIAITILLWIPDPDNYIVFFVLAGMWGMADAIWQTQINAFYGVTFPNQEVAAFSNYRLWESFGFIIAFAYSNYLCVYQKLYILLAILAAGMSGYLAVEYINRQEQRKQSKN